ncbi:fibropellin-1-like [Lingula anatina]|uniref:Fibropellin-1-like n=1 Tax=Lingula anatina TaxID=7574 RepID=A0A1S3IDD0_LINAN|nr:fibropellin-1-like [Lingula anatina]|eukprot:XP_013395866.1 fibropellin-1-like [Lingula anatina]
MMMSLLLLGVLSFLSVGTNGQNTNHAVGIFNKKYDLYQLTLQLEKMREKLFKDCPAFFSQPESAEKLEQFFGKREVNPASLDMELELARHSLDYIKQEYLKCTEANSQVVTTIKDNCIGNSCRNNGTCIPSEKNYTCRCLPGYSGDRCEKVNKNPCGSILHHSSVRQDNNTGITVPAGWVLCYIDSDDVTYAQTPCINLLQGVTNYQNFGCWHGCSGSVKGPAYASNDIIEEACRPNIQQTNKMGTSWCSRGTRHTTFGVCIQMKN